MAASNIAAGFPPCRERGRPARIGARSIIDDPATTLVPRRLLLMHCSLLS
jgi:hypothetical protein